MKYLLILLSVITVGLSVRGKASYYSDRFQGRRTASGDIYDKNKLTCASNKFNIGDSLRVINLKNDNFVVVVVNDRMSDNGRIIDLSKSAAKELDMINEGIANVKIYKL